MLLLCYSDTSRGGACLLCGGHVVSPFHDPPPPPPHLLLIFLSRETPGARRGVTAVSGMPGGCCSHFPGLHLHLRLSDASTRISYTSGRAAQSKTVRHPMSEDGTEIPFFSVVFLLSF